MTPLTTERLTLRRLTLDDGEVILEFGNDPAWLRRTCRAQCHG